MDSRPPKRQRRSINKETSQGDSSKPTSNSKPISLSSRPKPTKARPSPAPSSRHPSSSPSTSPSKPRSGSGSSPKQTKTKSLHSFFQPANEGQRWSAQKFETKWPLTTVAETLDTDEIEDDYDSYDEIFTQHIASQTTNTNKSTQSSSLPAKQKTATARRSNQPSKRFLLPPEQKGSVSRQSRKSQPPEEVGTEAGIGIGLVVDNRPWAQRFGPSNLDELVVHKRKVGDVGSWLEDAFSGRCKEAILRGPAGSGKTTTISLLSDSLGFDIIEWRNPTVSDFTAQDYVSASTQFEEFLGRGDHYGGLDLEDKTEANQKHKSSLRDNRILLVEEFPAVLSRNSGLTAFRASIQRYLASATDHAPGEIHPPLVMIISETLLGSASSVSDNFTVHRLLGPSLYNHSSTKIIDFNSVAPTFMQKALRLVLEKESRESKRAQIPGPAVLDTISEIGDVRSAVSSLEFLCLKSEHNHTGAWGGTLTKSKGKKVRKDAALTPMEEESLKLISQREASLGLFHAVGKIVYNKRLDPSLVPDDTIVLPSPPEYLAEFDRPKVSQVEVNDLIDETGTDITTFVCGLHENYPPSCHGTSFTDNLNACIEALSDSDILSADRRPAHGARGGMGGGITSLNSGVDKLRQDEISFQVAARGLLFGLPYPVNRRVTSLDGRGHSGNAHKMLYPTSLRLWRKTEEIEGLVDSWMTQLLDPSNTSTSKPTTEASGVKFWQSFKFGHHGRDGASTNHHSTKTMLSRPDVLLHQLPYMAHIKRNTTEAWELNQITKIKSSHIEDVDDDEDIPLSPSRQPPPQPRYPLSRGASGPQEPEEEEKLILSDDDIEDD
ncbi:hypothetical protein N7478_012093 [Penicillium angulare]|uniref:uncharacterized protein n=1 Tax=Penicillium angulare TaxID=116970 RepID=UPI00254157DF|nr:uncharacterized protein N7478_012093 [Penicillium angulare]KAJ5260488.1 hypothetical protein N7478_012093 [Penicillium angulare]